MCRPWRNPSCGPRPPMRSRSGPFTRGTSADRVRGRFRLANQEQRALAAVLNSCRKTPSRRHSRSPRSRHRLNRRRRRRPTACRRRCRSRAPLHPIRHRRGRYRETASRPEEHARAAARSGGRTAARRRTSRGRSRAARESEVAPRAAGGKAACRRARKTAAETRCGKR